MTDQEKKIASLLSWGLTQKEIAEKLHISPATVNGYLKNIYKELGIHKETDLTRIMIMRLFSSPSRATRIIELLLTAATL